MDRSALNRFAAGEFELEGAEELIEQIKPHLCGLAQQLLALSADTPIQDLLAPFATAIEHINTFGDDIETIERESVLSTIYDIGELVGLNRATQFAERWRGDW